MAVHRGDIGVIKKALTDYELKAQEMNVGVNYMALDDERRRQEHLLRELREIEEKIASLSLSSTELPHLASIVGTELSHNTKCLQYLTGISELERSIGEVATHFAERSVKLSDPNSLHKSVVTYKTLTDNVKSCWTYVDQLATLAQIHLKTSAEYHQFYHEANEIEAKLEKQLVIAQKAHHSATMRRSHKETTKVANEIREQLNIMQSLWQRSKKLVKRSETIVPIRMRLGGVAKGVAIGDPNNRAVMVQAMVSLTGPDYKIQKGEHLQLIDNRQDSHLWRVQTSSGIVEVPSICFWLTDTDAKATERAISIKQLCKKTWLEIINLISLRLYEVYVDLLQQFNSQEVVCSHEGALNMLLADLQRQLISTVGQDGRLQSEVDTFRKGVIITKRLERLQSGDINLREPDIVQIRSPLLRLQDHLVAAEQMQQEMKLLNDHIADYLSEVDNERWQISRTLDHLNRLTKKSEQQLNEMMRKIEQMKSGQEMRVSQQTSDRLKVQPLIISEQEQLHKRSRSQPRMTVVNAISSSTTSSDSEPTSDPRTRSGKRRAKSQVRQLDAMVQIGSESKTAETQHQEGRIEVGRRHSQRHKSVQLAPMKPVQLEAQTQIGRSVIDFEVQVDTSSLESYNMVIKGDTSMQRSRSLTPSSEDDEGHEYITEATAALSLQALKDKGRRRITTAAQSGPLSKKKSSSLTNMVHCYTQLGSIITDRAVSPLQAFDSVQSCPNCRPKTLLNSQIQVGQIYSGSEKYPYYPVYEVKSESARQQHLISKKVQSGYPCLTDRANLYCQCDVLGPLTSHVVTEVTSDLYQKEVPPERRKMHSDAQIGVLYANARQQAGNSDNDMMSTSTQVGIVHEDPYQESHISHERRSGLAQTRPRSTQELCSFSGMIETLPLKPDNYVTAVSMRPQAATSSTQIGVLLSESALQTGKYDGVGVSSKRSQIGHSMLSGRSDSYTQVGQLYQQAGVQKGHVEINVEPGMVPVIQAPSSVERSVPPPKNNLNGMSIQVTPKTHDDTRQIANVLSHNEVQTRDLPNFNVRQQNLQVYDIHRHKPRRSSSVPSVQFSTETQIGPMVMHESLSPINVDTCVNIVRPTEMLNVKATPRVMKNKRIQSAGIPSARNVGMQIGHLLQESGTQSMVGVDNFEETPIAPTLLSVQQKAISMPNVGIAETQTQPLLHGKKMQVSISMYSPTAEKKHNKKLQVSIVTSREMYDVQVETVPFLQKEQFDVSCDTKIQPDKIPKKIQVSLLGSGPEILMVSNQDPVHASMPPRSPVETVLPVQPQLTAPVQSAPPSRFTDIACEAVIDAVYFDAKCQCDDLKPMTQGKKLQVELGGQMIKPKKVDIACDSNDLVKTVGKKLQVDLNAPSQTTLKEMKDEICAALDERKMFDATQQTVTTEEQLPIFAQATAQPVYSAPPVAQTVNTCDTACEALRTELACDGFTQSEKIQGVGKKLQVAITFAESEKPVYEIATMQAYSEDAFVSLAESSRVRSVYAASPPRLTVDMEDRGCEAMPKSEFFDASVQSAEFVQPKPMVLGKKLQVSLPNLTTSSIQMEQPSASKPLGYPKAIQAEEFYTQLAPHLIPLQEAPKVYSAPQIPHPEASTEDRACDAIASSSTFDAAIQATGAPKPEVFGKKLQVNLMPLVVMSSQSTIEFQPPSQPIYLENATRVFSAPPPPAQPKVQTDDKACDAITTTPAFDAGVQIAEQEKPRAFVVGKKLQVKPPSLSLVTAQTIFEQPPPQVIHLDEAPKAYSAPPIPSHPKVQMEEKSCDAIKPIKVFDAGVQAAELQQPKAVVVGKKLQVTLPPALVIISSQGTGVVAAPERPHVALEVSGVQTVQELTIEPPTQAVHVQETSRVFAAPSPQPHVQTDEKSCDAIEFTSLFDAGVQAAELQQPKAVVVGKKLQVTLPPALVIISSQGTGVVAAPERPHVALEVSGVQTVQELTIEPPTQAVHVQETSRVFAAPSPQPHVQTDEKSCDAIEFTSLFDAGVQAAELQQPKAVVVGKKLQVTLPPALVIISSQGTGVVAAPERPHVALEVSGVQTVQELTIEPPTQAVHVQETSRVFAAPSPQPHVQTDEKSCDAIEFTSLFDAGVQAAELQQPKAVAVGKKLQVTLPPALVIISSQGTGVVAAPERPHVALEVSGVQTVQELTIEPPTQAVHVQETSRVFAAPSPQPHVQTDEKSCDAIEFTSLFDAGVQAAELQQPKAVAVGKKLQVTLPPALVIISSQGTGVVAAPERPHVALEVSGVQTVQELTIEPPTQAVHVQETSRVFAAPSPQPHVQTDEKSCDAIEFTSLFDAGVQVADILKQKPRIVGKNLQVSLSSFTPVKSVVVDKGIQMSPLALKTSIIQWCLKETTPPSQIIRVEETNKVFAVPPPSSQVAKVPMTDKECETVMNLSMFDADVQIGIISPPTPLKIGKKLQVCPAPYSILSVQTREETPSVIVKPVALGKKLQVSPPPLELSSVQSTLQVESVPQPPIVKTEEARIVFAAPPSPLTVTVVDAESDALELGQLFDASTQSSPVTFADTMEPPEKLLTCGKKLQADIRADLVESKVQTAAIVKLEVVRIQTETEPTRRSITNNMSTQANNVQQPETPATYGKKMQVDLHPPMDEKSAQIELPYSLKITSVQTEMAAPTPVMIPQPAKVSQSLYSAPPRPNTEDRGIDAKYLPLMSITVTQADAPSPTISYVQSTFHQPELTVSKVQMCDFDCNPLSTLTSNMTTQSEEVIKFGKKMQVTPPAMEIGISQTTWQEVDVPPIIGVKEAPMIRSAPPLPTQVSMKDAAADPLSSKQCTNAFTQVEPVPTYGKKMQVVPPALCSCTCQAVPTETSAPSPVIKSAKEAVSVFIAPPVKALTTEDKACEPMFKTPVNDVSLQYDTITHKPPSRSVRIQKGVGAFEGKRAICVQYNAPEPRRSPLSPLLSRNTSGIEWGVQIQPTTLVGTTQTPPTETSMVFTTSKPDVYSRTTQVDLDQYKPVKHADLFSTAPIPARQPQNLFSFVRETKARVSSRRIRSGSQGLIPYKTQVFSPSSSLSLSVPAMLNVQTEAPSPATIADCYGYTNHIAASQVPRRYISRFRSPTVRGSYDRRNKSMENIYFRGSRTMPRQFISDSDLTMANRRILQQMELEERCEECITHCVRLIGYEKAAQMLMDARICAEFGQHGNLEGDSRRRHLQNARTQYTSTTTIACPYCCQASVREGEGRTWWPSGAGEEEFYSGEDGYEWDSMQSSYGSAKHGSYRWVSRTPIIRVMQTEPTSDAVDMLMKNRALSAYCSDYELQQSGINANFEENAAFTFVAWKTDQQGEDKLELDTVGNLLRLTLVGARVPGTGEVISAADAFYRSILRVIYMDDERGVIMPLTTAINANAVIVEKRFSTGVGISFHHPSRKYPVECTAVWQTPNMRRRTYRVNYIRLSDKERIPVSKALEQGIIDKYSGEIVGVRTLPKAEMGDPLLQMRESSVGTGDTMARKQHPERFNVREAILNDIVSVDLIQPEIILLPSSEADTATHSRRREGSVSPSTESNSDLEV